MTMRKHTRRRIFTPALFVVLAALLVTACGSAGIGDDGAGTVQGFAAPARDEARAASADAALPRAAAGEARHASATTRCSGEVIEIHKDSGDSSPSGRLLDWVDERYTARTDRAFGEGGSNNYFSHTIPVPQGTQVISATLTLDVTNGGDNDSFGTGVEYPSSARTGQNLSDAGIAPGTRGTMAADLDSDITQQITDAGSLDVVVQDDSTVHSITLYLCVVPTLECPGEIVRYTSRNFERRTELATWVADRYSADTDRSFGEDGSNNYFHNSLDIGPGPRILDGVVLVDITNGDGNDAVGASSDYTTSPSWSAELGGELGIAVDHRGVVARTLSSMGILGQVNDDRNLDVIVQDDSTVHAIEVRLCLISFGACPGERFELTNEGDDFAASDELAAYVAEGYGGQRFRDFGDPGGDKYFNTSADWGNPVPLFDAYLSIEVTNRGSNDSIGVGPAYPTDVRWTASLPDAGVALNQTGTIQLTLSDPTSDNGGKVTPAGADLLAAVAAAGSLDVIVQDDSTVHSMRLVLCPGR